MIANKYFQELQYIKKELVNLQADVGMVKENYNLLNSNFLQEIINNFPQPSPQINLQDIQINSVIIAIHSNQNIAQGTDVAIKDGIYHDSELKKHLEELVNYLKENTRNCIPEEHPEKDNLVNELEDASQRIESQLKKEKIHSKIISNALKTIYDVLSGITGNLYEPIIKGYLMTISQYITF